MNAPENRTPPPESEVQHPQETGAAETGASQSDAVWPLASWLGQRRGFEMPLLAQAGWQPRAVPAIEHLVTRARGIASDRVLSRGLDAFADHIAARFGAAASAASASQPVAPTGDLGRDVQFWWRRQSPAPALLRRRSVPRGVRGPSAGAPPWLSLESGQVAPGQVEPGFADAAPVSPSAPSFAESVVQSADAFDSPGDAFASPEGVFAATMAGPAPFADVPAHVDVPVLANAPLPASASVGTIPPVVAARPSVFKALVAKVADLPRRLGEVLGGPGPDLPSVFDPRPIEPVFRAPGTSLGASASDVPALGEDAVRAASIAASPMADARAYEDVPSLATPAYADVLSLVAPTHEGAPVVAASTDAVVVPAALASWLDSGRDDATPWPSVAQGPLANAPETLVAPLARYTLDRILGGGQEVRPRGTETVVAAQPVSPALPSTERREGPNPVGLFQAQPTTGQRLAPPPVAQPLPDWAMPPTAQPHPKGAVPVAPFAAPSTPFATPSTVQPRPDWTAPATPFVAPSSPFVAPPTPFAAPATAQPRPEWAAPSIPFAAPSMPRPADLPSSAGSTVPLGLPEIALPDGFSLVTDPVVGEPGLPHELQPSDELTNPALDIPYGGESADPAAPVIEPLRTPMLDAATSMAAWAGEVADRAYGLHAMVAARLDLPVDDTALPTALGPQSDSTPWSSLAPSIPTSPTANAAPSAPFTAPQTGFAMPQTPSFAATPTTGRAFPGLGSPAPGAGRTVPSSGTGWPQAMPPTAGLPGTSPATRTSVGLLTRRVTSPSNASGPSLPSMRWLRQADDASLIGLVKSMPPQLGSSVVSEGLQGMAASTAVLDAPSQPFTSPDTSASYPEYPSEMGIPEWAETVSDWPSSRGLPGAAMPQGLSGAAMPQGFPGASSLGAAAFADLGAVPSFRPSFTGDHASSAFGPVATSHGPSAFSEATAGDMPSDFGPTASASMSMSAGGDMGASSSGGHGLMFAPSDRQVPSESPAPQPGCGHDQAAAAPAETSLDVLADHVFEALRWRISAERERMFIRE